MGREKTSGGGKGDWCGRKEAMSASESERASQSQRTVWSSRRSAGPSPTRADNNTDDGEREANSLTNERGQETKTEWRRERWRRERRERGESADTVREARKRLSPRVE